MGAYQDFIDSLSPDHYWRLDGNSTNTGITVLTNQTPAGYVSGVPLTQGSTNSGSFSGSNSLDYGDSTLNLGGPWSQRSYSCWATFDDPNRDSLVYNEGANVRNFSLYFSLGGVPAYIVDNDADSGPGQPWSQAIYGPALVQGKAYHMGMVWESNNPTEAYVKAYLDGVLIQRKEITNNAGDEVGGLFNAHSGNIELGLGQTIIVSGQTFNVSNHVGLIQDCAVWDGVLLTDAQMLQLFQDGALPATATATFTNVPAGTRIVLMELDSIGGVVLSTFGELTSAGGTETISYTAAVTVPARLVIVDLAANVISQDILLPRAGQTFPADLLLNVDRVFENP